jgi:hypothetical protein
VQKTLNIFQSYCEIWKLEVNVHKRKVMIFSKGKIRLIYELKLQNKTLEIVDSYSYREQERGQVFSLSYSYKTRGKL